MTKTNFFNLSATLSPLKNLILNPTQTFNFLWVSAETNDDINYYNTHLFEELKSETNLFCFYLNYASKSKTSTINTYIDIINKVLTQNRTLSSTDYLSLKTKLIELCDSTNYFKLFINDNLQKIQLSYNVIYDDYKYEHHNFNYHLSIIIKCISDFFPICLIIENAHYLERHIVSLLSSFLLSKPRLTIVFSFCNSNLNYYPSLKEFFSLTKINNYLSNHITLPFLTYHDVLSYLKSHSSLSNLDSLTLASLIIKKSCRSIFLAHYFINNLSFLESDFVHSHSCLTTELLISYLFNALHKTTKQCLLLASLEDSPFNLYELCRYYNYDYETVKKEALASQFIVPETSFTNTTIIRDEFFQFSSIYINSIIFDLLDKKQLTQVHNDHISYSIQTKKTISSISAAFIINPTNTYQFPNTISKDFFSQVLLEAYSAFHLETYHIAHDFFLLILNHFQNNFRHSQLLHFDIAYHHLLCKLYSNHSDIEQDWKTCFDISSNANERALLHLFKLRWLHQKEFAFDKLLLYAKHIFFHLNIHLGFIPKNKISLAIKFGLEFTNIFIFKLKQWLRIPIKAPLTSNELLIVDQTLNLLVLNAPFYLINLIVLIKERIIYQATRYRNPLNVLSLLKQMKYGEIKKINATLQSTISDKNLHLQLHKTSISSLYNLVITLFYTPLKYNLQDSNNIVQKSLNQKNISPNNAHYWLASIIFQQNFQLFNGDPLTSIQKSYDLNIFFFQQNCQLSSSSMVIEHANFNKKLLLILAENTPFNYQDLLKSNSNLIETNDNAEFILKFLIMFICFYKQDFKSVITIAKKLENKLNDYTLGIFYPLFSFYYSLALFFDYKLTDFKDPYSLQLLLKHLDVFQHLLNQDLTHYQPYYNILNSIKHYYHKNQTSHRLILDAIKSAEHHKQVLAKLIAHEITAIFYKDLNDKDNVQTHINLCINEYNYLNYTYKSKCLSKYYHFYFSDDTTPKKANDNIVFLLKNKTNIKSITDIELSYMFQFIFHFIDFDTGYFFQNNHNDLVLNYRFLSKNTPISKHNESIKTLPQFIKNQSYHSLHSKEILYQHSIQNITNPSNDTYVLDNHIHSILAIPLLTPTKCVFGVLYFENKLPNKNLSQSQLNNLYNYINLFELIIHNNILLQKPSADLLSFDTTFGKAKSSHHAKPSFNNSNNDDINAFHTMLSNLTPSSSNYFNSLKENLHKISSSIIHQDPIKLNPLSLTNLSALLNYVITISQPECRKRSIIIQTDFAKISDFLFDFNTMILLFFNLIIHRIDTTQNNSSIYISTNLFSDNNHPFIAITISDTNTHLSTETLLNSFTNTNSHHTINLAMILPIIDAFNGNVYISSYADVSTYMTITLPHTVETATESSSSKILSSYSDKQAT